MVKTLKNKELLGWANILRQQGLKVTKDRLLVLSVLKDQTKPLSIQEIEQRLGRHEVNQVTLYRILKQLTQLGLVRQLNFRQAHARYELQLGHHHHVICQNCGAVKDFEVKDNKLVKLAGKLTNYQIRQHNLELFGLCRNCQ
jgi:Fur family transcriptional regulator, peroxide stress response regulator